MKNPIKLIAGKSYFNKLLFKTLTLQLSVDSIKDFLPPSVNLLAVSKGHTELSIRNLTYQGQFEFGESRLQEALPKIFALEDVNQIRWHFIGRLQRNKVRSVVRAFDVIHSVDCLSLAKRISKIAVEEETCPEVMLQVKLREDPSKIGFNENELLASWSEILHLPNMHVIGLMTISPISLDLKERKKLFSDCRDLANHLKLKDCSMGMSNDWREAVEAGSTWIRIGSLLFGERFK